MYHRPWTTMPLLRCIVQASGSRKRLTPEDDLSVCGDHAVIYGVMVPCQTFFMPHITLIQHWVSIYIHVSMSLDHHSTAEVYGSSSWFQKVT